MKKSLFLFTAGLLLMATACNQTPTNSEPTKVIPKHIIIVGFDGFSADCVNNGVVMSTLRNLMAEGAYTLENRSVLPTSSAVNWASMFMGAGPELHGHTEWNSIKPDLPSRVVNSDNRFPNIYGLYRDIAPDAEMGYIYEWSGLNYLVDTLAFNFRQQVPMDDENPDGCTPVAVEYIKANKPNVCAVLFDKPDGIGHKYGWDSEEYYDKMTHLDNCLAQIIAAAEEAGMMDDAVIVVVSDHGGIDKGHGGKTLKEQQTPLVFYGKGIKKGHYIEESTVIYDIAATLAYILDVEQPQVWTGRPIMSIFE